MQNINFAKLCRLCLFCRARHNWAARKKTPGSPGRYGGFPRMIPSYLSLLFCNQWFGGTVSLNSFFHYPSISQPPLQLPAEQFSTKRKTALWGQFDENKNVKCAVNIYTVNIVCKIIWEWSMASSNIMTYSEFMESKKEGKGKWIDLDHW